jgi:sugar transferase (PEP-CTERM/EpsH1 system associated)
VRVLFLSHRLPFPPNKGEKIRAHWELKQLLAAGHSVDLFCFYSGREDKRALEEARTHCSQFYAEPLDRYRAIARALAAIVQGRPFTTAYFHSKAMSRHVQQMLARQRYDLVFVYCSSMAPYVLKMTGVPRILDLVDVDSDKWAQYAEHSEPPSSWLWRREAALLAEFEKEAVSSFEASWVCTAAEARVLRGVVDSPKIGILENALDADYFNPEHVPLPEEIQALKPYVIFAGSMDYFPNVDAVKYFYHDIFPLVRRGTPQLSLVIAGRSPARAVRQLARDPAVRVTGWVPDLRPYLKGAAVAVAPMRIARGVQNKILEAMAMGLPVVASGKAAAALPEDLAGFVAKEDEPSRFAHAVEAILRASVPGSATARRGAVVNTYSERHRAARFERMITEVVQREWMSPSRFQKHERAGSGTVAGRFAYGDGNLAVSRAETQGKETDGVRNTGVSQG